MVFVGPIVAEAMFVNREEVPVYPVYRDPVSVYYFDSGVIMLCCLVLYVRCLTCF